MRENLTLLHDYNKIDDQPAHVASELLCHSIFRHYSIPCAACEMSKCKPVSVAEFEPYLVRKPEDRISRVVAKMIIVQHKDTGI